MRKFAWGMVALLCAMSLMGCSAGADSLEDLVELEEIAQESIKESQASSGEGTGDVPVEYTDLFADAELTENNVWVSNKSEYTELIEDLKESCEKNLDGSMIFATDDEVIFAGGFNATGSDGVATVSPFTTYEIGGLAQSMTAAAILQLVQDEKLKLTDTIGTYLSDYPYGNKVTVEHLLYMTSGIADPLTDPSAFFGNEEKDVDQLVETIKNGKMTDEDFLQYAKDTKLLFEPGTEIYISTVNYILLAHILEQITGQSYEEHMKENIFDICKMKNSTCAETGNLTSVPIPGGEELYMKYGKVFRGAVDIHSSPCDVLLFDRALMKGELIDYEHLTYVTTPKNLFSCGWIMYAPNCLVQTGTDDGYVSLNYIYTVGDTNYYFILMSPSVERGAFVQQIDWYISKFIEGLEK